jgi:hypothetical protein
MNLEPSPGGLTRAVTASVRTGVLNTASGVIINDDNVFRRYLASVNSSCQMIGVLDSSERAVVFNVGRRGQVGTGLARDAVHVQRFSGAVNETVEMQADLSGMARKSSAYPATWPVFDMAGVVERLGCGIAHYANHGVLTAAQLRGGGQANLLALGIADAPIAASGNHVFVPSMVETSATSGVMAALLNAVSGEGGVLVTDMVALEPRDNSILQPTAEGAALAIGCYHALEILGANYIARGAGAVYAYALTRGIHMGVTVTGHSDEGAVMRDVLRRAAFAPPSGGIMTTLPKYTGLAKPSGGLASFQAFVDGIALATAGAVAACDPMIESDGKLYPTVLLAAGAPREREGCHDVGTIEDSASLVRQLAVEAPRFCEYYIPALCELFNVSGNEHVAKRHMVACFNSMVGTTPAHLRHKVIAPWFWVEPTGVYDGMLGATPATREGLAQLCGVGRNDTKPFFAGVKVTGVNALSSSIVVDWRCARRHGLLHHLQLHKLDGLANIVLRQMDPGRAVLPGRGDPLVPDTNLRDRMLADSGMQDYLWGRGHSSIIAPAELVVTGGVGIMLKHAVVDPNELHMHRTHCPSAAEIPSGQVVFATSAPVPLANGPLRRIERGISRARTRAAEALSHARSGLQPGGGWGDMGVQFVDPLGYGDSGVMHQTTKAEGSATAVSTANEGGTVRVYSAQANAPVTDRVAGPRAGLAMAAGLAVGPRPQNLPVRRAQAAVPVIQIDQVGGLVPLPEHEMELIMDRDPLDPAPGNVPAAEAL